MIIQVVRIAEEQLRKLSQAIISQFINAENAERSSAKSVEEAPVLNAALQK